MTNRKQQPKFMGTMPDGIVATSVSRYSKAWRALAQPIADEFGWQTHGYEPGVSFITGRNSGKTSDRGSLSCIFLPIDLAHKIHNLILEARQYRLPSHQSTNPLNMRLDEALDALNAESPNDRLVAIIDDHLRSRGWILRPLYNNHQRFARTSSPVIKGVTYDLKASFAYSSLTLKDKEALISKLKWLVKRSRQALSPLRLKTPMKPDHQDVYISAITTKLYIVFRKFENAIIVADIFPRERLKLFAKK